MISFFVSHEPAPQGSKTATVVNGRAVMFEASKKVKPYREAVKKQAIEAMRNREMITDPVEITLHFLMPRPKSVNRIWHTVKPDIDKLVRASLDPLTGVVFKDDAQVVAISAAKDYSNGEIGCKFIINAITKG